MADSSAGRSGTRGAARLPTRFELALTLLAGSVLASLFLAALETAMVVGGGEAAPSTWSEIAVLFGSCAALIAPPSLGLAWLAALVVACFPASAPPARALGAVVRWLLGRDAGATPRLGAARILSVVASGGLGLAGALLGVLRLISDETTAPRAATLVALAVICGLPLLWFVQQAFLGLLTRLFRARSLPPRDPALVAHPPQEPARRPRRWPRIDPAAATLAVLLSLSAAGLVLAIYRSWTVILLLDLRTFTRMVTWIAAWLLAMRWLLFSPQRLRWAAGRLMLVGTITLGAAGYQALYRLGGHDEAKVALMRETLVAAELAQVYQKLLDGDGDGSSTVLGDTDCDDADPAIHPGARDEPGNGVDEDCYGGDLPKKAKVEPSDAELALAALRPHLPPAPNASGRWNIVLVSLDTVWWEHTSMAGYRRMTTPKIQALADRGTTFTRHWAQAPQTKSSMPSMLTGRYTTEVFRSKDLWLIFYPENVTFPELLKENGYRTAGVASHMYFGQRFGLPQGFDYWDLGVLRRDWRLPSAGEITDRAISYLRESAQDPRPYLLWVHYIDPHDPYVEHKDPPPFGTSNVDRYDGEIRYTDGQVGRLLRWIEESPEGSSTLMIVHADHGEGFGMHGYNYHGQALYEDQIRVPLVIHLPGQTPRIITQTTGNVDLAPTILQAARIHPRVKLQGKSLIPLVLGEPEEQDRPIFAEVIADERHVPRKAMIRWPYKLEYAVAQNYFRLYDLAQDPKESKDLTKDQPAIANRLIDQMRTWMASELEEIPSGTRGPRPGS